MELTQEQYERIQDYLDGNMSEEAQHQFLQELNEDAELMESLLLEKELREDLSSMKDKMEMLELQKSLAEDPAGTAHMKALIEQAGREWKAANESAQTQAKGKVIPVKRWRYIAVAAILLVITGGLLIYLLPGKGQQDVYARLYTEHFVKDAIPQAPPQMLSQALAGYEQNDYSRLQQYDLQNLPNIKGVDNQKQETLELGYYYKGISYMITNEDQKAVPCFRWVIDSASGEEVKRKARWYLALTYVKAGDKTNALLWLDALIADPPAGDFRDRAVAVAGKLRKRDND